MIIKYNFIKSVKLLSDPRGWYEIDLNELGISCPVANHNLKFTPSSIRFPINFGVTRAHGDPLKRDCEWIYGVDLDGNFFFKSARDCPEVILAHLAGYLPLTDTLTINKFIEA